MAGNPSLMWRIGATDNASAVLSKVGKETDGLRKKTEKLHNASAALAGIGVTAFATSSVLAYSNVQDAISALEATYGSSAKAFEDFANSQADAFNLSKREALSAEQTFANFARSAGLSGAELETFSIDLTKRAADMASYFGGSTTDAIEAISSALMGESEPIRKYGVLLDDATMRAKALEMGLISTTKNALSPQQKVLVAQALILEKTSQVQGDVSRTSDSMANTIKDATQQFDDFQVSVGQTLTIAVQPLLQKLNSLMSTFNGLSEPARTVIVGIGAVGAAALLVGPRILSMAASLRTIFPAATQAAAGLEAEAAAATTASVATQTAAARMAAAMKMIGLASIALLGVGGAMDGVTVMPEKWHKLDLELVNLGKNEGLDSARAKLEQYKTAYQMTDDQVTQAFPQLTALLASGTSAVAGGFDKAGAAVQTAGSKIPTFTIKAKDADDAARNLKAALDALGGKSMSVQGALSNMYKAFDDATAATKDLEGAANDSGTALDFQSLAGRTAQSALADIAKAADDVAEAQRNAGASTESIKAKQWEARRAFIAAAKAAGVDAAGAADRLANKYGLIPDRVATLIEANTVDATNATDKLIRMYDSLDGRTVVVTVVTANGGTRSGNMPIPDSGGGGSSNDTTPHFGPTSFAGLRRPGTPPKRPKPPKQGTTDDTAQDEAAKAKLKELRQNKASDVKSIAGGIQSSATLFQAFDLNKSTEALRSQADAKQKVADAETALAAARQRVRSATTRDEQAAALNEQADAERNLAAAKKERAAADKDVKASAHTAKNVLAGLQAKSKQISTFYKTLQKLKHRGLPASLLKQLVDAGPVDGSDMAAVLDKASGAEFADILKAQRSIDANSMRIGGLVAGAIWDPQIRAAGGDVITTAAATEGRRSAVYVSEVKVNLDGKQIATALAEYKKSIGGRPLGIS